MRNGSQPKNEHGARHPKIRGLIMTDESGDTITLQIYRAPSGQWSGRLLVGGEEIGRIAGCASAKAVQEAASESAIYPDLVEVVGE
jgi:hypothetical protein